MSDLLSRIDAAIGLRPELADLLGECRAAIVRLSEAAVVPVVDVTAMPRVYVASKSKFGPMWQAARSDHANCVNVISTWIDESGEGQTVDWSDLWVRCVDEASCADAVVAYYEPGDEWKGALVEIGAALAAGKPVLLVGEPNHSWVAHPSVRQFATVGDALAALRPSDGA